MRKVVAIGLSGLVVCSFAGAGYSSLTPGAAELSHQYTHLIETNQSQTFESLSQSALLAERTVSFSRGVKVASVTFITGGKQLDFGNIDFEDPTIELCKEEGYTQTSCPSGQNPGTYCPYSHTYFDKCCDSRYKYEKSACTYPNTISKDSCGGRFMCYCDRSLYPVESCASPKVTTSDSCTEGGKKYYSGCVCPSNYNQTCTGQNQQGQGTGCTYNGTTKYTSCQCKSGYSMTCTNIGPVTPSDYCLMNGIKYYNDCKTCENKCKLDSCPAGVSCTREDCSGKYCAVGCATGYVNWCTKPETDCAKLGYTKSVSQCADGYLQCPYNSAAVFCEDIGAAVGDILYGDGTVASSLVAGKTPIGIVFDTTNRLAVALTDVKQDGSAGSSSMYWASGFSHCDVVNLSNCTNESSLTSCGGDGQANTNAILAASGNGSCDGTILAATAVNNYEPSGCNKDFCKKRKWFLPSMRDLSTLYNAKSYINASLSLIASYGSKTLKENDYWSSTEYNSSNAWGLAMDSGERYNDTKETTGYIRPVVNY